MLEVISGPVQRLGADHRAAVADMTTARFTRDLLGHDAYIAEVLGLEPGTPAFDTACADLVSSFRADLAATHAVASLAAMFTYDQSRRPIALGVMHVVRGTRNERCIADAVGWPDSSLQTHALLSGFRYPALPGFDPYRLDETHLLELRRWVSIDPADLHELAEQGVLTSVEEDYVLRFATAEACVGVHRLTATYHSRRNGQPYAGYLCSCAPRSALIMRRKLGLPMIPLFADGCAPTALALSPACFAAPLFRRHDAELARAVPPHANGGDPLRAALRHLATTDQPHAAAGRLSLPYLLPYSDELFAQMDRLEDLLTVAEATRGVRVMHTALEREEYL